MPTSTHYHPFYCEENAWWLVQSDIASASVMFLTSRVGMFPMWSQSAAQGDTAPIYWDYHVVVLGELDGTVMVWDPDHGRADREVIPIPIVDYLLLSFGALLRQHAMYETLLDRATNDNVRHEVGVLQPPVEAWLKPGAPEPFFRLVARDAFVKHFATDRRHMLIEERWSAPPPPWPPPQAPGHTHNLHRYLEPAPNKLGVLMSLDDLVNGTAQGRQSLADLKHRV